MLDEEQNTEKVEPVVDSTISEEDAHAYDDVMVDVKALVAAVSMLIENHPALKSKNFGLYYQHGRLGYMDLDIMADKLKKEQESLQKESKDLTETDNNDIIEM